MEWVLPVPGCPALLDPRLSNSLPNSLPNSFPNSLPNSLSNSLPNNLSNSLPSRGVHHLFRSVQLHGVKHRRRTNAHMDRLLTLMVRPQSKEEPCHPHLVRSLLAQIPANLQNPPASGHPRSLLIVPARPV
jgi:hypothetical protein